MQGLQKALQSFLTCCTEQAAIALSPQMQLSWAVLSYLAPLVRPFRKPVQLSTSVEFVLFSVGLPKFTEKGRWAVDRLSHLKVLHPTFSARHSVTCRFVPSQDLTCPLLHSLHPLLFTPAYPVLFSYSLRAAGCLAHMAPISFLPVAPWECPGVFLLCLSSSLLAKAAAPHSCSLTRPNLWHFCSSVDGWIFISSWPDCCEYQFLLLFPAVL